ncbi:MAG: exodeoxyribonuclease VII large subunit [Clostridia bacterium]|nr:exodeoxyribonuclease VII large subunit [Clostridia bacterium]
MLKSALTVRQLNLYVRSLIEGDARLSNVLVSGELSNFKNHYASGHLYFTLKDREASIRCVMFRSFAERIKFKPLDGLKVVLRGRVSIYEKDGQYQFYAEEMMPEGVGDIALGFEQVKAKLEAEGLFDQSTKRPLPKFPKRIAVVTSDTGAAVKDIMNILSRRWSLAEIVLCSVAVQGEQAVPEMLSALDRLYSLSGIDVIIIGRGGGSAEDLWAFNSEQLARKIYESPVPVISAVGHETDFTICDFVADLRAPTPSAAAELAVPNINEISSKLNRYENSLKSFLENKYQFSFARLEALLNAFCMKNPTDFIVGRSYERLDRLTDKLSQAANRTLDSADRSFVSLTARLDALSPLKVLSRGYAAVSKDNGTVSSVTQAQKGDILDVSLTDGTLICVVKDKKECSYG